jgi:hypothetical protein
VSYPAFTKIPRWNRETVLTEKLDGTNGLVAVCPPDSNWHEMMSVRSSSPPRFRILTDGTQVAAGSRKRWLNPQSDNFEFAQWVWDHAEELAALGKGLHYGEWYGKGINRAYGLPDRRFALFNVARWGMPGWTRPDCCEVVTALAWPNAAHLNDTLRFWLDSLAEYGSVHVSGFRRPEGIVIYHTAGNNLYKVTFEGDQAKTLDGYVVRTAGRQVDIGLDPEEQAQEKIRNWSSPPGTRQFVTQLATTT